MFKVVVSNRFRKDLKLAHKRGLDLEQLNIAVSILAAGKKLEKRYRDHELTGEFAGFRIRKIILFPGALQDFGSAVYTLTGF